MEPDATIPATPVPAPAPAPLPAPVTPMQPPQSHSFTYFIYILAGALFFIGGGTALAYFAQVGPFSVVQYTEATFLTDILAKAVQIKTSSYSGSATLAVNAREAGATPFLIPDIDPIITQQYANDVQRVDDLEGISRALVSKYSGGSSYDYTKKAYVTTAAKPYPATLANLTVGSSYEKVSKTDPVTKVAYAYAPTNGGKDFTLSATLETSQAEAAIQSREAYGYRLDTASTTTAKLIEGHTLTLTSQSGYVYLSSTIPKPFFAQIADMLRSMSPDVSGTVAVAATTDLKADAPNDWLFQFTANGSLGDLTYAVDAEVRRKDDVYYFRINKIPDLFFGSLSSYKGKWVKVDPAASSTDSQYGGGDLSFAVSGITSAETEYKKQRADVTAAFVKLVKLADTDHLIAFKSKPVRDTVDGRSLTRYDLTLRKEAIIPFYTDVLADTASYSKLGITDDAGILDYLKSKDFDDVFTYMQDNVFISVWTDAAGYPAQVKYRLRVVPPDTATQLKDKQIDLTFTVTYSGINQPVQIDAPADTTSIQEVMKELDNNLSDARVKGGDAAVKAEMDTIRIQSALYYDSNNGYGKQAWGVGAPTLCTSGLFKDQTVASAMRGADTGNRADKNVLCYAYGTGFVAGADLASSGWWCTDSAGTSKQETGTVSAATTNLKSCP